MHEDMMPTRGIETWFSLTSKNMYTRLRIVDTKANILITANSVIISVVLGSLYMHLKEDPHLIFAVGSMVITNLISIIFAILAAIPRPQAREAKASFMGTDKSLTTFDSFHMMSRHEYSGAVNELLSSGSSLYQSMIHDIHNLGVVLARKYQLIRYAFLTFFYGVILSVMAFGVCHLLF